MITDSRLFPVSLLLALVISIAAPVYSQGDDTDLVVVVSAENTSTKSISVKQLRKLYLGKSLKMPDGTEALLVTYKPLKTVFNKTALGRSNAQVEAVWSRLKFSGRAKPPQEFDTAEALIGFVSANLNAVAYLPASGLTVDVRIVLQLPL